MTSEPFSENPRALKVIFPSPIQWHPHIWAVFITAAPHSLEALDRVFLLIQDSDSGGSQRTLLTSKDLPLTPPPVAPLPLPDVNDIRNDSVSMSPAEIHAFV
ncbi:hypothetical protein B0H19DRAFT_1380080 [Mycena capillaripes]|nr:hypothetical protein B0H19DRAFT_1380080 [Mycena capillaripes]